MNLTMKYVTTCFLILLLPALFLTGCAENSPSVAEFKILHRDSIEDSGVDLEIGYIGPPPQFGEKLNLYVVAQKDGLAVEGLEVKYEPNVNKDANKSQRTESGAPVPVFLGASFTLEHHPETNGPGYYTNFDHSPSRFPLKEHTEASTSYMFFVFEIAGERKKEVMVGYAAE